MYVATLTTELSEKVYVGEREEDEFEAKRSVATLFLEDPEVQSFFDKLPPKIADIRAKVLHEGERRRCLQHGAKRNRNVITEIQKERTNAVLAIFREWGYRTEIWDQIQDR
eukprot:Skav213174  [mRNA]  locus=scaffold11:185704:186036:- [translate_table: standard]